MATFALRISKVIYDDTKNTITLTMQGDSPARPDYVREDLWYPTAPSFIVTVPVNRGSVTLPSGVYVDPGTGERYSVTYDGTSWSEPRPVDARGKPKEK